MTSSRILHCTVVLDNSYVNMLRVIKLLSRLTPNQNQFLLHYFKAAKFSCFLDSFLDLNISLGCPVNVFESLCQTSYEAIKKTFYEGVDSHCHKSRPDPSFPLPWPYQIGLRKTR